MHCLLFTFVPLVTHCLLFTFVPLVTDCLLFIFVVLVTRCLLFMLVASGATLTFDDVKKTDSGRYVCYAENVVGLTSGSVTLDVQCEYLSQYVKSEKSTPCLALACCLLLKVLSETVQSGLVAVSRDSEEHT